MAESARRLLGQGGEIWWDTRTWGIPGCTGRMWFTPKSQDKAEQMGGEESMFHLQRSKEISLSGCSVTSFSYLPMEEEWGYPWLPGCGTDTCSTCTSQHLTHCSLVCIWVQRSGIELGVFRWFEMMLFNARTPHWCSTHQCWESPSYQHWSWKSLLRLDWAVMGSGCRRSHGICRHWQDSGLHGERCRVYNRCKQHQIGMDF